MMHLYIDADLVAFRAAASANEDNSSIACYRVDDTMHNILDYVQPDTYSCYLTGSKNFRKDLYPEYKANRKLTEKPQFLSQCREHMERKWNTTVIHGMEADDALGIAQCTDLGQTMIASLDKDLLMIPGSHYNWVKGTVTVMEEAEADRRLYWQMLVGDVSDNIQGIRGLGPKKSDKILTEGLSVPEMFQIVRDLYSDDQRFLMNLNVLYILQKEGELWNHKYMDLLIQQNLVQLAKDLESKCSLYNPNIYSGFGSEMGSNIQLDGVSMGVT